MKWWRRLVKGTGYSLLDTDIDFTDKIIVYKETNTGNMYTYFDTYLDFFKFYSSVEDKMFHEIIIGNRLQKPRFDIDISDNLSMCDSIFEDILNSIVKAFFMCYNTVLSFDSDVLIFTSHGEKKKSYHIIIDNYCHVNNEEAKEFYHKVCELTKFSKYIDSGVYNNTQSLRIYQSHKLDSDRHKIFNRVFTFKGNTYCHETDNQIEILKKSLVSYTKGCYVLHAIKIHEEKKIFSSDIDIKNIEEILNKLDQKFKILKVEKNIVCLLKVSSYHCYACKKHHDNENPFLTVIEDKVYFNCRRSGRSIIIGNIIPDYKFNHVKDSVSGIDMINILN